MKRLPFFIPFFCIGMVISFAFPKANAALFLFFSVCFLLLSFFTQKKLFLLLTICFSLCLGIFYGFWRTEINLSHRLSVEQKITTQKLNIQVISTPENLDRYTRFYGKVLDKNQKIHTVLFSDYHNQQWQKGEIWQIESRLTPPVGILNVSGFNRESWALANQIDAFGTIRKNRQLVKANNHFRLPDMREKTLQRILEVGKNYPQGKNLIAALTIGKTEYLTPQNWQDLRNLGITHLVSISGLHIGCVAGLTALFCLFFIKKINYYFNYLPTRSPKIVSVILGLFTATIYAYLAGFSIPTQRSLMMIVVFALSLILKKYFTVWKIWQIALIIILLINPTAALTAGFYLSFGLTAAIIFYMNHRIKKQKNNRIDLLIKMQYAAIIASIVPLGLFFAAFPLVSPIANAIFIPLFSIILVPLSLFALICPFDFPLYCAIFLAEYTINTIHFMAQFSPILPIAKPPILWIILSLIASIILLLPRGFYLHFWAILILCIFIFYPKERLPETHFQATVYDVGQGLAVLIATQNHALLFDTGKENTVSSLISSLYANNIKRLDMLVLSHNDNDHDGGRNAIQAAFKPKTIVAGETDAYDFPVSHCTSGTSWEWDGVWFEWLTPKTDENAAGNDKSCVLRVLANGYALLVTGDLSQKYEQKLVEQYDDNLYSQVLILGHHGSKTSSSSLFLDSVRPDYAIVSASFANAYFHPHPSVLKRLNQRNISVYRTDYQGALRLNTVSGSLNIESVKKYRPYWQQKPIQFKN